MPTQVKHSRSRSANVRRSYVTLLFGIRVPRKTLRNLMTVGLVSLFAMCALGYYIYTQLHSPGSEAAVQKQIIEIDPLIEDAAVLVTKPEFKEPEVLPSEALPEGLEALLDKYRAVSGLGGATSLMLHGSYDEDGRRFKMKLAAKAPNLLRKTLSDSLLEMTYIYNGSDAHVEIEHAEKGRLISPIEDILYQQSILLECSMLALAADSDDAGYKYTRGPDQDYAGFRCWTVLSQGPSGVAIKHLIDPETGYEHLRYVRFEREGQTHQMSVHFSDFRSHGSGVLPFCYELKLNGERRGIAQLETIQTNPGLMPWMFFGLEKN